jgi:hypothetical protein
MIIRYVAIIIILIKFISLNSTPLIAGQGLIALTFTAYFVLATMYFVHRKKLKKAPEHKITDII